MSEQRYITTAEREDTLLAGLIIYYDAMKSGTPATYKYWQEWIAEHGESMRSIVNRIETMMFNEASNYKD